MVHRINVDWQARCGHGLEWLESFVERDRFRETCHQAANWQCVVCTRGRRRHDRGHRLKILVKDICLYHLVRRKRQPSTDCTNWSRP